MDAIRAWTAPHPWTRLLGFFQPAPVRARRVPLTDRSARSGFVANRAVRSVFVVVSTPSLAFSPRIVEAHEPMRVQAFRSEFDSGLARSREVERNLPLNDSMTLRDHYLKKSGVATS